MEGFMFIKIRKKYLSIPVSSQEYTDAQKNMTEEEFKNSYYMSDSLRDSDYYYKMIDATEAEVQTIILDKILVWVKFFGIITIAGIAAAIILLLI
jgi:hypothetical protein